MEIVFDLLTFTVDSYIFTSNVYVIAPSSDTHWCLGKWNSLEQRFYVCESDKNSVLNCVIFNR